METTIQTIYISLNGKKFDSPEKAEKDESRYNLAFFLSMPGCMSWNGKWSGSDKNYVIVNKFTLRQLESAKKILETGYYDYTFSDGWRAGIKVQRVTDKEYTQLRKTSDGFCGYAWMVQSILSKGIIEGVVEGFNKMKEGF